MGKSPESLRRTFDSVAEAYDAARPEYPDELYDDLVQLAGLEPGALLLEIGCGTGKATRPLLERGFRVVAVELGSRLAERARVNLTGRPFEVHVAAFEDWDGRPGSFALVYAATAWHWLEQDVSFEKSHRLLRPGGHLAFWGAGHAFPAGFDPFFTKIQAVYDQIGESHEGDWPPPEPQDEPDEAAAIEASGLFVDVRVRRYLWDRLYTADEYIALLDTFSGHIAMDVAKRDRLYREIRRRLETRPDPRVRRHFASILHVARRVGPMPG